MKNPLCEALRRVAACAPVDARPRVVLCGTEAPSELAAVLDTIPIGKTLTEADVAALRAAIELANKGPRELEMIAVAVRDLAAAQQAFVQSVERNTATLLLPVMPKYDAKGKLIAAERSPIQGDRS